MIPTFVVEKLKLAEKLDPILKYLETLMGPRKPYIRTHNIIFAPIGSGAQTWHYDDSIRKKANYRYFTILIPLNPIDDNCGGTEIWSDSLQREDMVSVNQLIGTRHNINAKYKIIKFYILLLFFPQTKTCIPLLFLCHRSDRVLVMHLFFMADSCTEGRQTQGIRIDCFITVAFLLLPMKMLAREFLID